LYPIPASEPDNVISTKLEEADTTVSILLLISSTKFAAVSAAVDPVGK
jgi:hypothetical protein